MRAALTTFGRSAFAIVAGSLLVTSGCAGPRPLPSYVTSTTDDPKYPRSRFIVEVASSTQSEGDAELQARAKLAADISAELTAETSSFLQESGNKESQSASVEVKQRTRFERADLIAISDHAEVSGTYYARAVLERAKADAEYSRAQKADLVTFTQYSETAQQAADHGKPGEFATAKGHAMKLRPALEATFIVRRALLGHPSEDERQYFATRDALLKAAAQSEAYRVVEVRIEGAPAPELLQLTVAAVRKLGLRVAENQTCAQVTDHAADATELVVSPEETCSEGSLGEKCEVAVRLHARGCLGGGEGEGRTQQMRGIHPSERERARTAAWKHVNAEVVESAVGAALRGAQVVDCSAASGC